MRTQEIREMEKRAEMYRKLLIWNLVFLLGLLCWGSMNGQYKWQKTYGGANNEEASTMLKIKTGYILGVSSNSDASIDKTQNRIGSDDYWIIKIDKLGNKIWDKTYGSDSFEKVYKIFQTSDGGYLIGGNSSGNISGDKSDTGYGKYDLWVLKLDSNGNKIWDKTYGGQDFDYFREFVELSDGYIITATSMSDSSGNKSSKNLGDADFWMMKIDKNGNKIWDKSYGGNRFDNLTNIIQSSNKSFLLCGHSSSSASVFKTKNEYGPFNPQDYWVLKVDSNGNKIWDSIYGSRGSDILRKAIVTKRGNILLMGVSSGGVSFDKTMPTIETDISDIWLVMIDSQGKKLWDKTIYSKGVTYDEDIDYLNEEGFIISCSAEAGVGYDKSESTTGGMDIWVIKLDSAGNKVWDKTIGTSGSEYSSKIIATDSSTYLILAYSSYGGIELDKTVASKYWNDVWLINLKNPSNKIIGKVYPDFNSNCNIDNSSEYNIANIVIYNSVEKSYAISNDNNYVLFNYGSDSAVLRIVNIDSPLYVSCGKDSIKVKFNGSVLKDTSGINFPLRSVKSGSCPTLTSHSSIIVRPGRWSSFMVCYQNKAMDTAFNSYIEIKVDLGDIDSIVSPHSYTQTGNKLIFQLGNLRPFEYRCLTYQVKIKANKKIGTKHCHKSRIFPDCNLKKHHPKEDSSDIECSIRCLSNDTVELTLANIGLNDQKEWGLVKSYEDIIIFKIDSFKLNKGNNKIWKYKIDTNKVYTAEIHNNNYHHIYPNLIIHDDECSNKNPILFSNPIINFSRHDEAKEYEEACTIVRGSYDPNIKSVQPVGMFAEHYTSTGTELKYRIDFQNTGTDTAFRVVLVDTLSSFLDIASFVPGVSSHPYSVEFGGRAVKFIFDPISLIDSGTNEPASHGYVHFKIKHIAGISPKTKIENKADIYFDYNAPIRTNTVFNTIFDTIQIYVPKAGDTTKGKDSTSSIQGVNQTSILVFPNPTTDKFFIQMSEPVKDLLIEIYDMQGRLIKTASSSNNQTIEVSAQGMTKGIYHIRCMSGEKLIVLKKVMVE